MSQTDLVLTLDGGGSSFKAHVASAGAGTVVGFGSRDVIADHRAGGIAEFDPDRWWRAALAAMRDAMSSAGRPATEYLGVTCTGMRIPFVLVDARLRPLAPGVLNVDRRGEGYLDLLRDSPGRERLYATTGHWLNARFGLPKLLWFRDHEPGAWSRTRHVLQFHEWLVHGLSGEVAGEPSSAAMSQLVDVRTGLWASSLLEELGFEPDLFPPLHPAGTQVGGLTPAVAREIGLLAGTPVHVGGGDSHLAALGARAVSPGTLAIVGGSTTPLMLTVDSAGEFDPSDGPLVSPHVRPGLFALETNAGATGILTTWLRGIAGLMGPEGYAALDEAAGSSPIGANGLVAIGPNPEWGEAGWARVPPVAFLGLTPAHSIGDLARAVLESICFAVSANLEALERAVGCRIEPAVFTGGGSRSRRACQMLADVLGRELIVPNLTGASALAGARLVAGVAPETPTATEVFSPDPDATSTYRLGAEVYRESYRRLLKGFVA